MSCVRSLLVLAVAIATLVSLSPPAQALPRTNPADRLLKVPVDQLKYENAKRCRKSMTRGAIALSTWLGRNTAGTYWGGLRCERLGKSSFSMHAEGRAVDWHLDARDPAQRKEAQRLLKLLFSPDRQGSDNALARRMGIIEAIWDCRYYGFWMERGKSKRYSPCATAKGAMRRDVDPTTAHRDHIHFSLSWSGARMLTSYWRHVWLKKPLPKRVPAADKPAPDDQPTVAEPPDTPGGTEWDEDASDDTGAYIDDTGDDTGDYESDDTLDDTSGGFGDYE